MAKNCQHDLIKVLKIILFALTLLVMYPSHAGNSWFTMHEKGWHWYDDPAQQTNDDSDTESDPDSEMTAVQTAIHHALNKAILHPTVDNVRNYIVLQEKMTWQARKFSNAWQAALLQNPVLDYSVTHPVNNLARQIQHDEVRKKEDAAIRNLAMHSGLFFFYRSTCPYCRAFAPTVKQFSEIYGVKVEAITTDGIPLPEFPASRVDQGQSVKFHVSVEPALYAVNPHTHKVIPVGFGLMSHSDLRTRILQIATRFDGDVPA